MFFRNGVPAVKSLPERRSGAFRPQYTPGLSHEACLVYLDDIIIVGRSFEEHLGNIRKVLTKLKEANLKLSPAKCKLFRREVSYLGHVISTEGVSTDPEKVSAVKDWKRPEDVHDLRSFLGLMMSSRPRQEEEEEEVREGLF